MARSPLVPSPGDILTHTYPMNMKRKQAVVMRAPRLEGDSIPSMATTAAGTEGRGRVFVRPEASEGQTYRLLDKWG